MSSRPPVMRGDIWQVRFDPSEGDEIQKMRPAVVVSVTEAGRMHLHIVVPITGWRAVFDDFFWMVPLMPIASNGLHKPSAADAVQVKSVSTNRFQQRLGVVKENELEEIVTAIMLCIGYRH